MGVCWVATGAGAVGVPAVWRTTSAGCTLLLCSSRFRNLLRTSRMAIIVPLLPTILGLGLFDVKLKIAIFKPVVFQTLTSSEVFVITIIFYSNKCKSQIICDSQQNHSHLGDI